MVSYAYDYSFLLKTIKYILLPILAIVTVVGFVVFIYSRKTKKNNIEKYNYIIDIWTTLLAITIIGSLFAITLGFSLSLTKTIETYDLIRGHEIIYYLVIATPVVPFAFLFIYIYKFIVTINNKPKVESKKEEITPPKPAENHEIGETKGSYDVDYSLDFTKINEENKESEEENMHVQISDENADNTEEIIHIDDLPDKADNQNQDDIELL